MHRTYACFEYKKSVLHYSVTGKGKNIILAFHGFGQNADAFLALEKVLTEDYTIYSFDLFFHGKSKWSDSESYLTKEYWKEMLNAFLQEKSINTLSLLGFSMGGKFVLATLESFPEKVKKVTLIAPDGIKLSPWYILATGSNWSRGIMRTIVTRPEIYKNIVRIANRFRLVNKGVLKFSEFQMKTRSQRYKVYKSWVEFRHLSFDRNKLADIIKSNNIDLEIFLGKYDKMITLKKINTLLKKLDKYTLKVFETGHTKVVGETAKYYRELRLGIKN